VSDPGEDVYREPADALAASIDLAEFPHLVALLKDLRRQSHALGDVEPGAPEVDDLPAGPGARSALDDGRLEPVPPQPIGEVRTGDAGARDEDVH
jgi:hypothetical protein